MSLKDRINQLEDRERRLLGVLVLVFGVFMVVVVPVGFTAYLGSVASDNEAINQALADLQQSRTILEERAAERAQLDARYDKKAPALAGFLAGIAQRHDIEIPETQDQADVPHGKRFTERSTKITLRDIGMLKLAKLMQDIAQSGFPVSISRLNVRKRGTEPDSYNVQMVVSAFDRKAAPADEKPEGAEAPAEAQDEEAEEEE